MGVGVFESDFNGKGKTFLVDSVIYDSEDAYDNYVKDVGEEEAVSYDVFLQEEYQQRYRDFVQLLQDGAKRFFIAVEEQLAKQNIKLPELGTSEDGWSGFDGHFRCAYDFNDDIQVGVREWETDYVVGVAITQDPLDEDPINIISEHGLSAQAYKDQQVSMADALGIYLRYHLAQNGPFESRYRTSGYTSAAYSTEDAEAEMEKAVAEFTALHAASMRNPQEVLAENFEKAPNTAVSELLTEDLLFKGDWNYDADRDFANYVVYDSATSQVVILDGDFEEINETGIEISDQSRLSAPEPDLGYQVLWLENEENVKLIANLQRELEYKILITPQAFEKAFERDFFEEIESYRPSDDLSP